MKQLFVICLLFAGSLLAQDRAAISGTVTDPTGAVVPAATIELKSPAIGFHRSLTTSTNGVYVFTALGVGTYDLTVSKSGFGTKAIEHIVLQYGETRTFDTQLQVQGTADTVQIQATVEDVNRTNAEIGGVIETPQITELPVSGRDWASLMLLAPGAINYGDGAQRSIRFSGHSLDDSNFTFDGVDTSGVQEQTQKANARLNIALDAIQEFRVSTSNYTAESGSAGGAQVNVVSKSGSNDLHGSGFYALRNDALDSRSPFDGPTLPSFTLNQFGGSVGGAIVKDKAFFFLNYEGLRQDLGQTFSNVVPNAAFRAQVLATSPALKPIIDAYPVGQIHLDDVSDQVNLVASNKVREDSGMARFDYRFNDTNSMFVRYNIDNAYIVSPQDALGDREVIPLIPTNEIVQYQRIISPHTVNEVKFGVNRANYHDYVYGTSPVAVTLANFDGVSDTSLDTEVGTTFSGVDNFTTVQGRHTLKFGIDIRRIRLNNSGNTLTTSSIDYASNQAFIDNQADSATYLVGEGVVGNRRTFYAGYAQDEFKVTPNLTLNVGLRYEYYSVAHEILNRSAVVDIAGCGGFCPKGTPYYSPNTKDFGPRIGLAWAPKALHGKTVVRSGFGIYYGGNQNDDFSDPAESAVPRYNLTSSDFPALSFPLVAFLEPQNQLFSPKAIARNRKDLSYNNWDFTVQQQLPGDWLLQTAYTGGEGHHLFDKYTVNLINSLTGTRPLAGFSSFGLKANDGNNNFNALQISLQRRFVRGLLFQTNYMWSHGITDASIGSGESVSFQDMNCRACDRSSTNIDVRQNITINGIYQLPFGAGKQFVSSGPLSHVLGGWELAGIASARTGLPVDITMKRSPSQLPDGNTSGQRPNLVPGVDIYAANQTINNWFNPAAFAVPASGTWGDLGRYAARGPGMFEIDMSLQKRFHITERLALNFRAGAYNLLNHPVYSNPSGSLGSFTNPSNVSAGFGRITTIINPGAVGTGAPRRIEFMFRAEF